MIPSVSLARTIGWAAGEAPVAAKGLAVTRFAEKLDHPRTMITLPNGDRYEGEVIGVTRTGKGIYTFANGDRYEGDFLDNSFHGKGTEYVGGDVYSGDFVRNIKTGQGTLFLGADNATAGTFTGDLVVQGGTLMLGHAGALPGGVCAARTARTASTSPSTLSGDVVR